MKVDRKAELFQLFLKGAGRRLAHKAGDDDAADKEAKGAEGVDQPQHIEVVGDPEIAADFIFDDVAGIDRDDDLGLVGQGLEHLDLAVGREPGQHPGGVIVVE